MIYRGLIYLLFIYIYIYIPGPRWLARFLKHQQYSPEVNSKGVGGGYVLGGPKQPSSLQEGTQLDVSG